MRHIILILTISLFIMSCGQNDTKQKELELKERELAIKEKELAIKEKDTIGKEDLGNKKDLPSIEQGLIIGQFNRIPQSFENTATTCLIKSKADVGSKYLFIGQSPFAEPGGIGIIKIGNEQIEVQLIKQYEQGSKFIAEYSNTKFKVTYSLDYSKNKGETEGAIVPGILTVETDGCKKNSISVFAFWGT